jgi:hypothetical protein
MLFDCEHGVMEILLGSYLKLDEMCWDEILNAFSF